MYNNGFSFFLYHHILLYKNSMLVLKAIWIMAHLLQQGIIMAPHLPNSKLYLHISYM